MARDKPSHYICSLQVQVEVGQNYDIHPKLRKRELLIPGQKILAKIDKQVSWVTALNVSKKVRILNIKKSSAEGLF